MLNYGLVSTAIAEDRQELREGMRLLAKMAHKYKIPVTWAITTDTAQFLAKDLAEWHNEFGDEPLLMLDIKSLWETNWVKLTGQSVPDANTESEPVNISMAGASPEIIAEHLVKMRETLPRYIRTEWKKIQRALEWATPNVAGAEWKNQVLVHALEQVGFRGLWGYRWDERGSVAEVDRGCPFGCFYPSAEQHNFSAPAAGSIAGIPYFSAAHLDNGADNLRASLINDTIQQNYDLYVENQEWNRWLSYVEHVSALEVTQLGQETLGKLDVYFAHVVSNENTKLLPLSEMVDDYWTSCQQTEPTYIVATTLDSQDKSESMEPDSAVLTNGDVPANQKEKRVFFYYDSECQFTFYDGVMEPADMKNYISPPVLENVGGSISAQGTSIHGVEYHLPKIVNFRPNRKRSRLHITFTIESTKAMPYGVAMWGNHLGLQLENSNAEVVTWVDKYLLFARLALEPGNNEFEIVLTI